MSRMIQAATDSIWSHVALLWRMDNLDRIMVMESVESIGVRSVPLSHYVANYNHTGHAYPGMVTVARHRHFPLEVPTLTTFVQYGIDLLGTQYDTRELASIALRIVSAKLGLTPRAVDQDDLFICSEFIERWFRSLGLHIPYDPRGFIAPRDFATCPDIDLLWEIIHG
jgi:hypothetical protein